MIGLVRNPPKAAATIKGDWPDPKNLSLRQPLRALRLGPKPLHFIKTGAFGGSAVLAKAVLDMREAALELGVGHNFRMLISRPDEDVRLAIPDTASAHLRSIS